MTSGRYCQDWTAEEVNRLKALYLQALPRADICRAMGRSLESIKNKLGELRQADKSLAQERKSRRISAFNGMGEGDVYSAAQDFMQGAAGEYTGKSKVAGSRAGETRSSSRLTAGKESTYYDRRAGKPRQKAPPADISTVSAEQIERIIYLSKHLGETRIAASVNLPYSVVSAVLAHRKRTDSALGGRRK